MTKTIDLIAFCGKNDIRSYLNAPATIGDYTYASNGHLMVRVPKLQGVETADFDFFNAAIAKLEAALGLTPTAIQRLDGCNFKHVPCEYCKKQGFRFNCPECNGDGAVDLETDYSNYEVDCNTCIGKGHICESDFKQLKVIHSHIREFKIDCPACKGNKVVFEVKTQEIGKTTFTTALLFLLNSLPEAEIHTFGADDAGLIKFIGGEGLIMPMRV